MLGAHLCIEITHQDNHVFARHGADNLLEFVVKVINLCIFSVRCWCIYLAYCNGSDRCFKPCRHDSVGHWIVAQQRLLSKRTQYQRNSGSVDLLPSAAQYSASVVSSVVDS